MVSPAIPALICLLLCSSAYGRSCSSVSGSVFVDANSDNVKASTEKYVQGAKLTLLSSNDVVVASTTSDASGMFAFKGQFDTGRYSIRSPISPLSVPVKIDSDDDVAGILYPLSTQQFTSNGGQDVKAAQPSGVPPSDQTSGGSPSGLSKTHMIIIGSCVAAVVVAAVIVGIVVRRRRIAARPQARPQIVIAGAQLYSPPAASAPPLHDDSSASFEIVKPAATSAV